MHYHRLIRRFALIFTLTIVITSIFVVRNSFAAANYTVYGSTTGYCDRPGVKRDVQAGYQDSILGSELHGFWQGEHITVSFNFPDGRLFTATASQLLDGVVDMPPNYTTNYFADVGGDLYFEHPVTNKWPFGCYKINAYGDSSGQIASVYFVVLGRIGDPGKNPAILDITKNNTSDHFAVHDSMVVIRGANFRPAEWVSVWVTQPNGTVIDYPQQYTNNAGTFESTFQFTSVHQAGRYTFTALGTLSGYQVFAPFDLRPGSSTPTGWATLRVTYPSAKVTRASGVEVAGSLFSPNERVDIWMTLPNNAVRGLPSQFADDIGNFFATIDLDERLPLGHYNITAKGANSGRLVITDFDVAPNSAPIEALPLDIPPSEVPAAPQVTNSNSNGAILVELDASGNVTDVFLGSETLGEPTNIEGAENNAGPEVEPDPVFCTCPGN